MTQIFWRLYLISLPMVSAFAISGTLTLPLLCGIAILIGVIFTKKIYIDKNTITLFCLFCLPILLSATVNIGDVANSKFINHLLSYLVVFMVFYYLPRHMIGLGDGNSFLKYAKVGWYIAAVFAVFEFGGLNFVGFDINNYIPRPGISEYDVTALGQFRRTRSFAEESGHFAMYLVMFYFIFQSRNNISRVGKYIFYAALLSTFGVAAWLSYGVSSLYIVLTERSKHRLTILAASIATLFISYVIFRDYIDFIIGNTIYGKFAAGAFGHRFDRIMDSYHIYINSGVLQILFGLGPGYYDTLQSGPVISVVSLPALTLFQTGLVGFFAYIVIFMIYFVRARRQNRYFASACIFMFLTYMAISNYWFPWLWFLFAMIDGAERRNRHANAAGHG